MVTGLPARPTDWRCQMSLEKVDRADIEAFAQLGAQNGGGSFFAHVVSLRYSNGFSRRKLLPPQFRGTWLVI